MIESAANTGGTAGALLFVLLLALSIVEWEKVLPSGKPSRK